MSSTDELVHIQRTVNYICRGNAFPLC